MAKRKTRQRITASERKKILREMKTEGLTADEIARKYGVSKWTVYGWRQQAGVTDGRRGRKAGRPKKGPSTNGTSDAALRAEIRRVLPGILREEVGRAIVAVFGLKLRLLRKAARGLRGN